MTSGSDSTLTAKAHELGRARWPSVALPLADFEARLRATPPGGDALSRYPEDVFLATACALGVPMAVAQFEREFLQPALPVLRRFAPNADLADEIAQTFRARLFSNPQPRIASYAGSGPLLAWVRVGLTRTAIDCVRQSARQTFVEPDIVNEVLRDTATPESRLLFEDSRKALKAAVESSLTTLTPSDRTLLRLHYVDALNVDRIAVLFQVHRATVARRILSLREAVLKSIQDALPGRDRKANPSEIRSLWRLVGLDVQVSVERLLKGSLSDAGATNEQRLASKK